MTLLTVKTDDSIPPIENFHFLNQEYLYLTPKALQQLYQFMRKYKKVTNSIKSRTLDASTRFRPNAFSSPKNLLKVSSIGNKKSFEYKSINLDSNAISKRKCLNWFPRQIAQQTSNQRRAKTLNSCTPTLFESIQVSKNLSFINENQFQSDSKLVEYFSNNVFTPHIKFKRFSNILKNKYNKFLEPNQTERIDKSLMEVKASKRLSNKDVKLFQKTNLSLEPRIGLVRRPSSGFSMNRQGMVVKKRKNSFNEGKRQNFGVKHIDTLQCFTKDQSQTVDREKMRVIRSNSQCIYLKRPTRRSLQKLKIKGEHFQSIDPWQVQFQKVKNFTDMQIIVKI